MAKYSDFLPMVIPYVPGCSEPLALQHIRDICIDFCAYSLAWQETLDPVNLIAGQNTYDLEAPQETRVQTIRHAWYRNTLLAVLHDDTPALRAETFNRNFINASAESRQPAAILVDAINGTFIVDCRPPADEASAITLRAALIPTRQSSGVPDLFLQEYEFAISQGAISRLTRIPNQAFTDLNTAMIADSFYRTARLSARIRANKSFSRAEMRVQMRPFA